MSYGVSFIIPTLNSQKTLSRCLSSIEKQKYPKSKIEVLILDGGSDDTTCDIAKKFKHLNLKFIKAGLRNNMEGRRLVGFKKAKHDFVCILDSDNYLGERNWISKMMKPLEDNDDLVGSFTLHYHYDSKQTPFGRYLSLFGGHDPVSYYLGKTDRQKWTTKKWGKKSQIKSKNKFYTLVQFSHSNFPTLGSNGFI
ncbi:glycosyltransferase family 2 protein, partial [Patescibacteria group bacterium]|nr:glycosyltransferase family 2 protein [Patescibacteria group bacterium]